MQTTDGDYHAFLTLPEALLVLAHERSLDKPRWGKKHSPGGEVLNRALLAAGLLELMLQDRIVPLNFQTGANLVLYRLAPDYEALPTTYTNDLWNAFVPHIDADLAYPFRRLIRLAQIKDDFGDGFQVPDQAVSVAQELEQRGIFKPAQKRLLWREGASSKEHAGLHDSWKRHLYDTVLVQAEIKTDTRTMYLLGVIAASSLIPPLFGDFHTGAEARIRSLCRFATHPETPIGDAYAYIRCLDCAE